MKVSTIISVFVALVLGVVLGYSFSHQSEVASVSAVGTTNSTQKIATITFAPTTGTATSTSILNTDSNDRIIDEGITFCSGVGTSKTAYDGTGLAALVFRAATTSASAPNTVTNTNFAFNSIIATSSVNAWVASSSPSNYIYENASGGYSTSTQAVITRVWASGSYLTFWSNATNTATCTVGVRYFQN